MYRKPDGFKKLQQMPGIVGYIVQPGDSLWKIAKKFHTTVETIMTTNGLTDSLIKPGRPSAAGEGNVVGGCAWGGIRLIWRSLRRPFLSPDSFRRRAGTFSFRGALCRIRSHRGGDILPICRDRLSLFRQFYDPWYENGRFIGSRPKRCCISGLQE